MVSWDAVSGRSYVGGAGLWRTGRALYILAHLADKAECHLSVDGAILPAVSGALDDRTSGSVGEATSIADVRIAVDGGSVGRGVVAVPDQLLVIAGPIRCEHRISIASDAVPFAVHRDSDVESVGHGSLLCRV